MNARNYQGSIMRGKKCGVAFFLSIAAPAGQVATYPHDKDRPLINLLGASTPISSAATILALDAEGFRTLRYLLGIFVDLCSFCPAPEHTPHLLDGQHRFLMEFAARKDDRSLFQAAWDGSAAGEERESDKSREGE
jgi:hypothetical protein